MIKISPSILSADFNKLGEAIKAIDEGKGDLVHIDIMDGHFVPNLTIGPSVVKALRGNTKLDFDVHLMIENPDKYIPKFIDVGANIIAVHPETSVHLHRTIQLIKSFPNMKAAVALNPSTPIQSIESVLLDLDMIVIMTVNPGFPAQAFIESMLPKIERTREMIDSCGKNIDIEVDGGVNASNISDIAAGES
jgi:ribulose-phosphate 3-epimerase